MCVEVAGWPANPSKNPKKNEKKSLKKRVGGPTRFETTFEQVKTGCELKTSTRPPFWQVGGLAHWTQPKLPPLNRGKPICLCKFFLWSFVHPSCVQMLKVIFFWILLKIYDDLSILCIFLWESMCDLGTFLWLFLFLIPCQPTHPLYLLSISSLFTPLFFLLQSTEDSIWLDGCWKWVCDPMSLLIRMSHR